MLKSNQMENYSEDDFIEDLKRFEKERKRKIGNGYNDYNRECNKFCVNT